MASSLSTRTLVRRARRHLDEWLYEARSRAFAELFEGEDPSLDDGELALLDRIDSALSRQGRDGIWGTDQYGVLSVGTPGETSPARVVCVYHPEVPDDVVHEVGDGAAVTRLNDALWTYAELVAEYAQASLEASVDREA